MRDKHSGFTRKQVEKYIAPTPDHCKYLVLNGLRRLGTRSSRKDFLSTLVEKVDSGHVDKEEMTAHVSTLV